MSFTRSLPDKPDCTVVISGPLTFLFALSTGVIVVNLFAPQILVGDIGPSLGFSSVAAGLIATATLLGYATGLFLLVPLADLVENRRLVLALVACAAVMAMAAAAAQTGSMLLICLFFLGCACSAIQILVPIAASMAPAERRGRVIGNVMSGLMVGILVSRPIAGVIADASGWRSLYVVSAAAMALLAAVLGARLPDCRPAETSGYGALIASLWHLLLQEPVLRIRAFSAAMVMASFSLFWTAVALRLAEQTFGLNAAGVALFALVGVGGAAVTPVAGRLGDRGWSRPVTTVSHLLVIGAMALAAWAGTMQSAHVWLPLFLLGAGAVMLDAGVTGDQTLGRRAINLLRPEARGRLNGLFVGIFFLGGALGSALAGTAWSLGGWTLVCAIGALFGVIALMSSVIVRAG